MEDFDKEVHEAQMTAFMEHVIHHKKYPGCVHKYCTNEPEVEHSYHG
jgi:hypothetical protein